jgi:hypothetical protein
VRQNLHEIADWLMSIQSTISHKLWTLTTGGAAAYTAGTAAVHTEGSGFIERCLYFFSNITLMEFLSVIALLMLIAERAFILWAWNKRRKRGDYNEGKV